MTATSTDANTEFSQRLASLGLRIQQPGDTPLFTAEPEPTMVPMHWRWADLEGLFDELAEHLRLVPGGGRRTLKLTNPGLPYGTTPTFWASIQYILPGEVATAHRHTPEAFRFVMYGHGCATTVGGENYEMNEGDLVLTPGWAWHDHVHKGDRPMIWLDVLDISLVRAFNSIFFENFEDDVQPIGDVRDRTYRQFGTGLLRPPGAPASSQHNPLLAYPKAVSDMAVEHGKGLAPDPNDDVIMEYQNPATGGPAMMSMSMKSQLLRPGFSGRQHRHTGSKVYWIVDGAGRTTIDGQPFDWSKGDFLAVPSWATVQHGNPTNAEARLFRVDESPVLRAVGLYREESVTQDWTPHRPDAVR